MRLLFHTLVAEIDASLLFCEWMELKRRISYVKHLIMGSKITSTSFFLHFLVSMFAKARCAVHVTSFAA
jgi:hypothetical protein